MKLETRRKKGSRYLRIRRKNSVKTVKSAQDNPSQLKTRNNRAYFSFSLEEKQTLKIARHARGGQYKKIRPRVKKEGEGEADLEGKRGQSKRAKNRRDLQTGNSHADIIWFLFVQSDALALNSV